MILKSVLKKTKKKYKKIIGKIRHKKLKNTDFSIISNNCWGGIVYQRYSIHYNSPTVGLYFFGDDYIKFVYNLKFYLSQELKFIDIDNSKYKDILIQRKQEKVIIGKLDNIEIIFLHYKTKDEAYEKWNRRLKRLNYDNMIIKFSNQNYCNNEHIEAFDKLPFEKKIFFDNKPTDIECGVYIQGQEHEKNLKDDIKTYTKYMDITKFLNREPCKYTL